MTGEMTVPRWKPAAVIAAAFGSYAFLGGVLTLLGWTLDIRRLTDWDDNGISQMPNNAIGVLALGAALILWSVGSHRLSAILGAFAGLIGVATLFEYLSGIDLGIDQLLLLREWGQRGTVAPGRMGPPGSTSLAILGTSVVLTNSPGTRRYAPAGGLLVIGIAMLSLIGYLFGADRLYLIPKLTTIALPTSSMLLALGIGLVATVADRQPAKLLFDDSAASLLVRRALLGVIVLPMAVAWLCLRGFQTGLFDPAFGTAILVLLLIALLTALLLLSANAVRQHEAESGETRDRLAGVLGSITDAFMTVDSNWRFTFANREAETRLGSSLLLHRSIWDVLPDSAGNETRRQLQRAMSERSSVEYEAYYPAWQRWFADTAYPTADGGLAIYSQDVTERKAAEEAVLESERKFALMFEKAAFGAALSRLPEGIFVNVNDAFVEAFGFTRNEVIGRTSLDLGINPDPATRARVLTQLERDGFVRDFEMTLRRKSGEPRLFVNNIVLVEIGGHPHMLTTTQDITERKAGEEALRASAEALRAADRMKDEFLATLSHELRTPLTSIIGWSHLLLHGTLEKQEQVTALETIRASAKAQAQLIDDVLDVSRMTTGKMRLEREHADLAAVIEDAVVAVRPAAEARRIPLRLDLDRSLPRFYIDPARIQQVMWNLLSNSIKFSPRGAAVEVALRGDDAGALIEVTDHGQGIPREFLPHLFERFRQADSSATRSYSGLGIGLALAKDLIEMHGGAIEVESEEGRGSRFRVRIPRPPAEVGGEESGDRAAGDAIPLDGVRVLYVDDRDDARILIAKMLAQYGAEVVQAASVDDALAALTANPPHVVVTDLAMPTRDGYELLETIRSNREWSHLPVVALTAQGRIDDEAYSAAAGFDGFLRKPIESHELAAAVSRAAAPRSE